MSTQPWILDQKVIGIARGLQSNQKLMCFVDSCDYTGLRAEYILKHISENSSADHKFLRLKYRLPTEDEFQVNNPWKHPTQHNHLLHSILLDKNHCH